MLALGSSPGRAAHSGPHAAREYRRIVRGVRVCPRYSIPAPAKIMSAIDLDGTVVAMTGASVGLGRSMSVALASAGARVVLAAPETTLLEEVAAEIGVKAGPGRALCVRTDITVRADCERM